MCNFIWFFNSSCTFLKNMQLMPFLYELHFFSRNVQLNWLTVRVKHFSRNVQPKPVSMWAALLIKKCATSFDFKLELHFSQEICKSCRFLYSSTFSQEMCNSTELNSFSRNVQPKSVSIQVALFIKKCATSFDFQLELHFSQEICNFGRLLYELHFFSINVQLNWFIYMS